MKKAEILILLFALLLLPACGGTVEQPRAGTSRGREAEAANHFSGVDDGRVDGSAVADYAAVLNNSEAFYKKTITVAGRVEASYDRGYERGFCISGQVGQIQRRKLGPGDGI